MILTLLASKKYDVVSHAVPHVLHAMQVTNLCYGRRRRKPFKKS